MGDGEVSDDGRGLWRAEDDAGAVEQCACAGAAAAGERAAGAFDLLHDFGEEGVGWRVWAAQVMGKSDAKEAIPGQFLGLRSWQGLKPH